MYFDQPELLQGLLIRVHMRAKKTAKGSIGASCTEAYFCACELDSGARGLENREGQSEGI